MHETRATARFAIPLQHSTSKCCCGSSLGQIFKSPFVTVSAFVAKGNVRRLTWRHRNHRLELFDNFRLELSPGITVWNILDSKKNRLRFGTTFVSVSRRPRPAESPPKIQESSKWALSTLRRIYKLLISLRVATKSVQPLRV